MHKFVESRINSWRSDSKPDQLNFNYRWLEAATPAAAARVYIGFLSGYGGVAG